MIIRFKNNRLFMVKISFGNPFKASINRYADWGRRTEILLVTPILTFGIKW